VAWGLSQGLALVLQRQWERWRARRGWTGAPSRAWTGVCWLLTMHYQVATIFMFADFHHGGWRVLRELVRRSWN
jgi:D-alanyl-lipoteichoic acid acyltransferase DltB (MBOAT superfamily)